MTFEPIGFVCDPTVTIRFLQFVRSVVLQVVLGLLSILRETYFHYACMDNGMVVFKHALTY